MDTPEEISKDDLKAAMYVMRQIAANIENWKYVSVNAELLEKKRVSDALDQMISTFEPIMSTMQAMVEVHALTTLDPYDLI